MFLGSDPLEFVLMYILVYLLSSKPRVQLIFVHTYRYTKQNRAILISKVVLTSAALVADDRMMTSMLTR